MNKKDLEKVIRLVAQVNISREEQLDRNIIYHAKQHLSNALAEELLNKYMPYSLQERKELNGSITYRVEFVLLSTDGLSNCGNIFRHIPELDNPLKICSIIIMEE